MILPLTTSHAAHIRGRRAGERQRAHADPDASDTTGGHRRRSARANYASAYFATGYGHAKAHTSRSPYGHRSYT